MRRITAFGASLAFGAAVAAAAPQATGQGLHERLLTLDAHLDTPIHFARDGWSFAERHEFGTDVAQLDLGRMAGGALDGGFFVIYTEQGPLTEAGYAEALAFARERAELIDRTLGMFPALIGRATTADEVEEIAASGRRVGLLSMENSYPLGEDLELLAEFQARGVRLAGPVHTRNNQLADSSTDTPRWQGLSPLGREWVAEMNRLGLVIDASHASDAAFDQMLALSRTPLLLSHSGSRTIHDHPRNLDDERIRRLAEAGGAICATTVYLSEMNMSEERAVLFDRIGRIGELEPAEQRELAEDWHALEARDPFWNADLDRFVAAVLHLVDVAGADHVCIGADWDGGGGIEGLRDVTDLPRVTARLQAAGLSAEDLGKIWSGNILRILRAAETYAGVQ